MCCAAARADAPCTRLRGRHWMWCERGGRGAWRSAAGCRAARPPGNRSASARTPPAESQHAACALSCPAAIAEAPGSGGRGSGGDTAAPSAVAAITQWRRRRRQRVGQTCRATMSGRADRMACGRCGSRSSQCGGLAKTSQQPNNRNRSSPAFHDRSRIPGGGSACAHGEG